MFLTITKNKKGDETILRFPTVWEAVEQGKLEKESGKRVFIRPESSTRLYRLETFLSQLEKDLAMGH